MACENVGEAHPDIAGIGLLVGFVGQAFLSLALATWVFFFAKRGRLDLKHEEQTREHAIERKRLELVQEILMVGNDIQMLTGIAYMITLFLVANTIDLYHFRLVFDTVSMVGVSNAAAMVCWTFCSGQARPEEVSRGHRFVDYLSDIFRRFSITEQKRRAQLIFFSPRHCISYVFAIMAIVLTALLNGRLNEWDENSEEPGKCYNTYLVMSPDAAQPKTDRAYVGVTGAWLVMSLLSAIFGQPTQRHTILILSFLQFPVHLYMMIALRTSNVPFLEGTESETGWDFGQTVAVLLLGFTLNEIVTKAWEFYKWEKHLKLGGQTSRTEERDGLTRQTEGEVELGRVSTRAHGSTSSHNLALN